MVKAYLGEEGGVTSYGNVRHVYYSNTAAPLIRKIIEKYSYSNIKEDIEKLKKNEFIQRKIKNKHIARRFQDILDFCE
ncbi:hypothetical protein [Acetobacter aceti]|uniref:Uncharacterized protein n=1 Tax=Acetobacter aceti TaxID=435 RepID=A0A6S6PFW5_ACEAC|nr:hypothetical protein [Acetobacter aceti]BCI65866.1 hypothetical protein AAJCM20276_04900 [Acetobacter aceti]